MSGTVQLRCSYGATRCNYGACQFDCLHVGKLHACTRAARLPIVIGSRRGRGDLVTPNTQVTTHQCIDGRGVIPAQPIESSALSRLRLRPAAGSGVGRSPVDRQFRGQNARLRRTSSPPKGVFARECQPRSHCVEAVHARARAGRNVSTRQISRVSLKKTGVGCRVGADLAGVQKFEVSPIFRGCFQKNPVHHFHAFRLSVTNDPPA